MKTQLKKQLINGLKSLSYLRCLALSGLLLLAPLAQADVNKLVPVGQAEMTWMMFKVYHATLKTADGVYQESRYPQALDIRYQRDISQAALLEATDQQWEHLGIAAEVRTRWLAQLAAFWPDIKNGDQLQFYVDAKLGNLFQHNGKNIGSVRDPYFSRQFLAIWLSPDTSRPDLRARLITPLAAN